MELIENDTRYLKHKKHFTQICYQLLQIKLNNSKKLIIFILVALNHFKVARAG